MDQITVRLEIAKALIQSRPQLTPERCDTGGRY